jgi:hypothetical protein
MAMDQHGKQNCLCKVQQLRLKVAVLFHTLEHFTNDAILPSSLIELDFDAMRYGTTPALRKLLLQPSPGLS